MIAGDGPDRERLEELARKRGLDGRARFTGRVDDEELADLYARCLAVYYAPVDEDFGMVPYEAFLSEKPVVTTTDAGGPLDIVADRRTGLVIAPQAAALAEACSWLRDARRRGEGVGAGRKGDRAPRVLGRDDRATARDVKVAYYSPLPPERSGIADYSALLLPALERLVESRSCGAAGRGPSRADVALYHVGNDPEAHGWIVDALRRRPGVVVLHDFVLHHLVAGMTIGRKDGHGYLAAMERDAGVPGRLLAHGVLDGRVPPPWETRPDEFPLAGEVLDHATGLIVHSRYVEQCVRGRRLRRAALAHRASGLAGARGRARQRRRQAAVRLLRAPEREQAHPAAASSVRTGAPRIRTRGSCSSGLRRPASMPTD